jgi:TolB-like protein/Tfp pilus assembly protein PilF/predicted Ser/Thr protein kinase
VSDVTTTAQRWQRVKTILADALEHPSPEDRTAHLERSCGGDTTLMREVEELLALSTENLDELADNTPVAFTRPAPVQRIGERIGAYEIVREIGRGGMGAVYLAKRADGQFEKEVAIKLLKRGTDTDEILRRFQAERRILARLDHPNIARLLDAGTTDDGLPYFVMEYIDGVPITDYVRKGPLSVAQRLPLFLKVCEAVQFAHQQRIVHRDLKPGNIFVRQDGEPKLLDFGIAKLLASGNDALELTLTAERRFTPVCASPEQARGETVTPASDVYALGALLYEMLTDRPPHRFSTPHPSPSEVAQVIGEQEPTRPSLSIYDNQVRRQLRGDLDNIVLTALRKEPARRYSSVAVLSEDIRRHVEGRAIRARPNTLAYVSRRFLGRQKYRISAWVLVAGLGTALGIVLFSYRAELRKRPSFSNSQAPLAIADKSIAVLPFRNLSNDTANAFFADGMQDQILTDLAQIADLKVVSRTSVMQYRDPARNLKEIGEALQVAYVLEGAVQRNGSRIHMNAQLVDTRTNARVWAENYDRDVADVFAMQTEVAEKIVTQLKVNLSPREKVAIAERTTNDVEAYDWYLRAKSWAEQPRVGKEGELEAEGFLDKAIQRDPNFARAYCLLSTVELILYRYFDHSPERQVKAENAVKTAVRLRPDLGQVRLAEAGYYYRIRNFEKARTALTAASRIMPNNSDVLVWSASIDKRQGRWKESLTQLERALEVDPRNPDILHDLINIYRELRRYSDSQRLVETGLAEFPEAKLAFLDDKFSVAYAIGDTKTCREIIESLPRGYNPGGHTSMIRFQVAFLDRDWDEAERVIDAAKKLAPEGYLVPIPFLYGFMARAQGQPEKARPLFTQARKILEQTLIKRPDDAEPLIWMGLTDAALGRKEEAIREGREAVAKEPISRDASTSVEFETSLAQIYAWAGEKDLAIEQLAAVVKLPNGPTVGYLKLSADWDDVRGDPRFAQIVEESARPIDLVSMEDKRAMDPAIPGKSIAVLPFENLSDDKANSFFAAGIQDELITDLAQVAELKVISRASVTQYTGAAARNVHEIARELGVAHLLTGTVQRADNRIRVNAQLINARTEAHEWAQQYDRDLSDLFAIQSEIARSIVAQLQARISPTEMNAITQQPTTDLVAYDLYLRANALMDESATSTDWEGDNRRAIDLLDRAVTHDPKFAAAYAQLCDFHLYLYPWVEHTPQRLAKAEAAMQEAIRLAPSSAATYLAQADFLACQRKWSLSLEFLRRAQKLQPGNAKFLIGIALAEDHLGQSGEAVRDLEKARELAPRDPNIPNQLTWVYTGVRDYRTSDEVADAAIANFPNGPNYYRAQKVLNALHRGDWKEAARRLALIPEKFDPSGFKSLLRLEISFRARDSAEFERILASVPRNNLSGFVERDVVFMEALLAEKQGDRTKMQSVLNAFLIKLEAEIRAEGPDKGPSYHPVQIANLALVHCYLGQMEEALLESQQAIELIPDTEDAMKWPPNAFVRAEVLMRAGQTDRALDLLEDAAKVPYGPSYGELLGLQWDRLRGNPRFDKIGASLAPKI